MLKKKLVSLTMVLILALTMVPFLASCGSTGSEEGEAVQEEQEQQEQYELRVVHSYGDNAQHGRNMAKFKELVEEMTDERITVTLYGNGQLGTIDKEISMVLSGTADATYQIGGMVEAIDPAEAIWTIPFLWNVDVGYSDHVLAADASDKIEGLLKARQAEKGLYRLANFPTCNGHFIIANNNKPIASLEDLKGVKLRAVGGMNPTTFFTEIGASPATIAAGEVPIALSQGVIDGYTSMILHVHDAAWETKYMTLPFVWAYSCPFLISMDWWDKLPADLQDIMDNQVTPAMKDFAYAELNQREVEYLDLMQKEPYNMQVTRIAPEKLEPKASEIRDLCIKNFVEKVGPDGQTMVDEVNKVRPEK